MISRLAADDVQRLAVRALSLNADALDLEGPESLAALVRRAASFMSPCSPRALREVTLRALRGIIIPPEKSSEGDLLAWQRTRTIIDATVESLAAYGDLL